MVIKNGARVGYLVQTAVSGSDNTVWQEVYKLAYLIVCIVRMQCGTLAQHATLCVSPLLLLPARSLYCLALYHTVS
jgi:hypothetical protein